MGKRLAIGAVALVVGLGLGFGARALAAGDGSTAKRSRTITVSSTATAKTAPDEAVVDLGVRSTSSESARAFAQNATDMQAVLRAVERSGVARKDIRTTNVSLDQRVEGTGAQAHRVFVASNEVEVTIHDLQAVGAVIDAAVGAGADSVDGVQFQLSDPNRVRTDALAQAVRGARTKADALAAAAGTRVVGVVAINEQSYQPPVYPAPLGPDQAGARTPIVPPSSLESSVTVQVVWEIG